MNLKVIRMSGAPVEPELLQKYTEEFKTNFDSIQKECGGDMLTMQSKIAQMEVDLQKKYAIISSESLPKSAKAWHQLIDKMECPILIAKSAQNPKELILTIMDTMLF